jgi:hypothetical protein
LGFDGRYREVARQEAIQQGQKVQSQMRSWFHRSGL